MNPYHPFVAAQARLAKRAQSAPLGGFAASPSPGPRAGAPKALFFAPHPDDESIGGGLVLRLRREVRWNVINVAITLGSRVERRVERLKELRGACRYLGFALVLPKPGGFEQVSVETRKARPKAWQTMVERVADLLAEHEPKAVFCPHRADWHPTHIGVHYLVMDALRRRPELDCLVIDTEFWGQMSVPNLLSESSEKDVAELVAATSFHVGEVRRNPYHLRLPAWMQDNVRRGMELVGGPGSAAPDFTFAQLYRVSRWEAGRLKPAFCKGRFLSATANPLKVFEPGNRG